MRSLGYACSCFILLLSVSSALGQEAASPAEQKIAWARKAIEVNPERYEAYNDLALALARRARETSDPAYYDRAEEALQHSFRLSPDNLEGRKVRIWLLLGRHEFAQALEQARALNRQVPDDLLIYGFLTDAHVELGDYPEAEGAAQWMLDLRPGNLPGLTRAAYLRELFGDTEGAVELLEAAYQRTPPAEVEDRAWILTHLAHLQWMVGKVENADRLLAQALALFPRYHYALAHLARVRIAQRRTPEAVDLLRQRYQSAPHPENLYTLAEALERAGHIAEARRTYGAFEEKARAEMHRADNANRELIFYYADHAHQPSEALRVARIEIARRRDLYTLDAYAWALHVNGNASEARKQIEKALAVGIRDASLFYHAGAIASKAKDRTAATRYLRQSLEANPRSEVSGAARQALASLRTKGKAKGPSP
ncbi:MAG: tetratricopeptide repeat protein [Candidatus Tectomicrobia bacterium]|uniref:Tetratricopeptide repeat protein n=1 Tax=Tectimicrobiota bacterium TaxID=2528274 RepID=A0A932CQU6_UNCTE|nr:tetratricopeptide repeat protein [Candidatus Tectomicrobia bacterium]